MCNVLQSKNLYRLPIAFHEVGEVDTVISTVDGFPPLACRTVRIVEKEQRICPLTERSGTVDSVHSDEKPFVQSYRLEYITALAHGILLLLNVLHPFSLTDIRARPERDLVVLAPEVHKGKRKTALSVPNRYDGCVW